MSKIAVLSRDTVDKIAAGEVVERPSSVVKELTENAIDAGADAVTVEIRDGGTSLIRITDNGSGIEADEVRTAFLPHATSKISTADDLERIASLGFRGEALPSICAVSRMEVITRSRSALEGVRLCMEGGTEKSFEIIGAPEGSTFIVRDLFYNTPARKKFLKSAASEAGLISDLAEHLALSHPEISMKLIINGQVRLHTSGNGNLKDVIYSIYGRDLIRELVEVSGEDEGISIKGFIAKPSVSRGNRKCENYFINGRYIKSPVIAGAIEEAYKPFMMQHRYPFTVLMITIDTASLDVNVHPSKMEVRLQDPMRIHTLISSTVTAALQGRELIPRVSLDSETEEHRKQVRERKERMDAFAKSPEPFEKVRSALLRDGSPYGARYERKPSVFTPEDEKRASSGLPAAEEVLERVVPDLVPFQNEKAHDDRIPDPDPVRAGADVEGPEASGRTGTAVPSAVPRTESADVHVPSDEGQSERIETAAPGQAETAGHADAGISGSGMIGLPEAAGQTEAGIPDSTGAAGAGNESEKTGSEVRAEHTGSETTPEGRPEQMTLFDGRLLSPESRKEHQLIGQIFGTYWLVTFRDSLYIIDQHAAHEKVMYERLVRRFREKEMLSQQISPPVILTLSLQEGQMLSEHHDIFKSAGFEIESFGGNEYAVSAVPAELYRLSWQDYFTQLLDSLTPASASSGPEAIYHQMATMACKAAVKGNTTLSFKEADALIEELLGLENPYNCPHGRPTIIAMSKYELERKFKRKIDD